MRVWRAPRVWRARVAAGWRVDRALVGAGVLTQIAYPLLAGDTLRTATVLSVLLLAAAATVHAGATWGWRGALTVPLVAGGLGLAAETVGVHTGFPFGAYTYAETLGPRLAGVPLVVPLAWTMLAYPCLLLGRRLGGSPARRARRALTGGVGLAGWDLFLDPQMVAQGHWSWLYPEPALPGVPGVPLTNYAGWLLVSVMMIAVLDRALPERTGEWTGELIPAAVLTWTWAGSVVGNLMFFGRPWVALYGGLVMGAVVVPYLLLLRDSRSRSEPSRSEPTQTGPPARTLPTNRHHRTEDAT